MRTRSILGRIILGFCLCFCLVLIESCKKGDTGPIGPAGTEGRDGMDGAQGDKGDRGATGAKGDKGDIGATGARGATGATGAKGDTGNANVKSTGWISIPSSKWELGYGAGGTNLRQAGDLGMYFSSTGLGSITEAEAQGGIVLVYAKLKEYPNSSRLLPFKFNYSTGGFSGVVELRFAYGTAPNTAHWVMAAAALVSGGWNDNAHVIRLAYLPYVEFCVVVIPPTAMATLRTIDKNNYEAVKAAFQL